MNILIIALIANVISYGVVFILALKLWSEKDSHIKTQLRLINLRTSSRLTRNAVVNLLEASRDNNGIKFIPQEKLATLISNLRTQTKRLQHEINSGGESGDNRQGLSVERPGQVG